MDVGIVGIGGVTNGYIANDPKWNDIIGTDALEMKFLLGNILIRFRHIEVQNIGVH